MDQRNLEESPNAAWEQERLSLGDQHLQAQQGDLAAIRDLLNQALAEHQILVHPVPGKNALHLELGAQHWPKAGAAGGKIVRRWVAKALSELGPLPWKEVALVAYQLNEQQRKVAEMPVWVERFEMGGERDRQPPSKPQASLSKTPSNKTPSNKTPSNKTPSNKTPTSNQSVSQSTAPQSTVVAKANRQRKKGQAITANASRRSTSAPAATTSQLSSKLQPQAIERDGWQALGIGLGAAGLIWKLPFLKVLFYGLVILVHELGHALTHWAFGQPAIPSVNLLFGGGITLSGNQSSFLLLLIFGVLGYLIYLCRQTPRIAVILAGGVGIYSLCVLGSLDDSLPVFMGHGLEAAVIGLCLYLSASGQLCRFAFDRTIYALFGWFLLIQGVNFAWGLRTNLVARALYEDGIGGMLDNDFVKLANQYWDWSLESIALLFLMLCLMAPVGAFVLHRYQGWLARAWQFLLSPEL